MVVAVIGGFALLASVLVAGPLATPAAASQRRPASRVNLAATGTATAGRTVARTFSLSSFLGLVSRRAVSTATIDSAQHTVTGTAVAGGRLVHYTVAYPPGYEGQLTQSLVSAHVSVTAASSSTGSGGGLVDLLPFLAAPLLVLFLLGARRRRDPGRSPRRGGFPHSAANPAAFAAGRAEQAEVPTTRFADVAGIDEAVDELSGLVDFLSDSERYEAAGVEMPHGYLLVGPPGTGKTLLARALAGEAGVPFFAMGASEFVESYVGVGAARVRTLFDRARAAGKSIVFIDELDAVGRSRSTHSVPGNEERETTLNQLLVEMDGFVRSSIIVLAATNRPDVLDSALLRPGRFDQQITVPAPDRRGRARILDLYLSRRTVSPKVDTETLSRRTAGFTGADLANLVNTAALLAVREGASEIVERHLDEALTTVALGPARKSAVVLERDRRITAWHEAGHALAGLWLPEAEDPISVSIIPRGPAGGVTWFPDPDQLFLSRKQARAQLAVAMGGRVGEELLLGEDFTQGAAQDFKAATDLARRMVTEYGMGSLGPSYVAPEETHLGVLAEKVHQATDDLLHEALDTARSLLIPARETLARVAETLLEEETLDRDALGAICGPPPISGSPRLTAPAAG